MSSHNIGFISLGCPKALVDSERILTQLRSEGYGISGEYQGADLVVVNTCGFIDAAKAESLEAIGEALEENGRVIVTGCMGAQREEVESVHPSVLSITGPHAYGEVMAAVHQHLPPPPPVERPYSSLVPEQGIKLTPDHYAYLKISEGCNHHCSFCIIPDLRGRLVSRPAGDVMEEAEALVRAGVRELLVISQDTSAYGVDLKYKTTFGGGRPVKTSMLGLSQALSELGVWVRLHYVYPYPHVDDVIPLMADGKILPYLDVPFQHASPTILKAMKRPAASENNLKRVQSWRAICPDLTIRSTFVVGFPGETEDDFQQLLDFLDQAQLDRVGCFAYSPVKGASANALPNHVPEELQQERLERLMLHQQAISTQRLATKVGQVIPVMIDRIEGDELIARGYADAPEVDGVIHLPYDVEVEPGDIVEAKIASSGKHDLWGRVIAEDD